MAAALYPFSLFSADDMFFFSFFFDNKPVKEMFCLLSARSAGNMGVQETGRRNVFLENLSRFQHAPEPAQTAQIKKTGSDPVKVYACSQTHSQKVVVITDDSPVLPLPDADGLVSGTGGVRLSITVADCLPVYLFDTETESFGIVHSGWKGTGIALNALHGMKARPETVCAVLGPCICGGCYRVDEERRNVFEERFGGEGGEYPLGAVVKGGCLDLQAANARLLANAGVRNIAYCENCTFTDERLGSFRREGKSFTKMMALIGKTKPVPKSGRTEDGMF